MRAFLKGDMQYVMSGNKLLMIYNELTVMLGVASGVLLVDCSLNLHVELSNAPRVICSVNCSGTACPFCAMDLCDVLPHLK